MTPLRRHVLETLRAADEPLGAYDLLERRKASGLRAQAPTADRALDFLVRHGVAHRRSSRRAFVACRSPEGSHLPALRICRRCERAIETCVDALHGPFARAARATGFVIERTVLEAEGVCADCGEGAPA